MARVLRSVKGHLYAYEVARQGDGRRVQRYLGPATPAEVAAWQAARHVREMSEKNSDLEAQGRPVITTGIHLYPLGDVVGRGFWRDGQDAAAFLAEAVAIYARRTGHAPTLAYCAPGLVAELAGCGLEVRAARVNERCVILSDDKEG